jgi:protoporphyrinogen oxidase
MESVRTLIVGAGVSGLATAAALTELGDSDYLILEADRAMGGYCKTVKASGYTWDYSGHFFHFKHPEIESWLRARMLGQKFQVVEKRSFIAYKGQTIDFPFQKNIHQLKKDEFIDCIHDLFFARAPRELLGLPPATELAPANFKEMLYARFGRSIAEKFLVPYNEKVYATDLATLDVDAMGRFFPHADLTGVMRNMKRANNESYNSTFVYPEGGAIEFINALASLIRPSCIALNEPLTGVDLARRVARTPRREISFERLVSTAPFNRLLDFVRLGHDPTVWSWNQVLVYNFGFDRKGPRNVHWIYYPDPSCVFYRIGFYDNIFDTERLSTYVEIGLPASTRVDEEFLTKTRQQVLADMRRQGVIDEHQLVAEHCVVMDPAYVHLTQNSIREHARLASLLKEHAVFSIGRYGGWTYCSIEDNIVEARRLVAGFGVSG